MAKPIQNRWAFLVGVDQYWKSQVYPRLNYCVKDVRALEQLLGQVGYEVVCLHDELHKRDPRFPDLRNVKEEFRKLSKAVGPDDLLLVYFACHGTRSGDGKPRLILEDSNPQALAETALSLEELENWMRGAGTERLVMMLDACHIGTGTAQRDVSDPEFVRNVYELATGFELLAASTDEQAAYELGGIEHGLFSSCVLKALAGSAQPEGLEVVTVGSLKAYVLNEMKKAGVRAGIEQDPQQRADGGLGDMILVDYRNQPLPKFSDAPEPEGGHSGRESSSSAPNLIAELNIKQLENLSEINGKSIVRLHQKWTTWTKKTQSLMRRDLGELYLSKDIEFLADVSSPLTSPWNQFIQQTGWHNELSRLLKSLETQLSLLRSDADLYTSKHPALSIIEEIINLDINTSYEEVFMELEKLVKEALKQLKSLIFSVENEQEKDEKELIYTVNLKDAKKALWNIQNHINSPFSNCFLVMGSPGAGKTFFLYSLLSNRNKSGDYIFFLSLSKIKTGENIEDFILKQINDASKNTDSRSLNHWNSIKHFNDFLSAGDKFFDQKSTKQVSRLVIVIDDFQKLFLMRGSQLSTELTDIIQKYSALQNIFWIITIRDSSYDRLVDNELNSFWERYSYFKSLTIQYSHNSQKNYLKAENLNTGDKSINLNGWVILDSLNTRNKVGLEIIKASTNIKSTDEIIDKTDVKEREYLSKILSNPFIAKILIELHQSIQLQNLINLNFVEFVESFWKQRRSTFKSSYLKRQDSVDAGDIIQLIDQAIALIARSLISSNFSTSLSFTALINQMIEHASNKFELEDRRLAKAAVKDLGEIGLLRKVEENIETKLNFFWEYEIAKDLWRKYEASEFEALEDWFFSLKLDQIQEGALEFFLLKLEKIDLKEKRGFHYTRTIWCPILFSRNYPAAAGWFAAAKASISIQKVICDYALEYSRKSEGTPESRIVFSMMYFMANSIGLGENAVTRLKTLQNFFDAINKFSLSGYYLYLIEHILSSLRDLTLIEQCLVSLDGCESLNIEGSLKVSQVAAGIAIAPLKKQFSIDPESLIIYAYNYLRDSVVQTNNRKKNHKIRKEKEWRNSFREWFIYELLEHLVSMKRSSSLTFLKNAGWYEPAKLGIHKDIGKEMQREANLAIGRDYRYYSTDWHDSYKSKYIENIDSLLKIKVKKYSEIAFFLMKHTAVENNEKWIIDKDFHYFLQEIYLDLELDWVIRRHENVFKDNLRNFHSLKLTRKKKKLEQHYNRH